MANPEYVENLIQEGTVSLPQVVLQELDKHKSEHNTPRAYESRRAVRLLKKYEDQIEFDFSFSSQSGYLNDDVILAYVSALVNEYKEEATLVTDDYLMQLKANAGGLKYISSEDESSKNYTGYKKVVLNDEELAMVYENKNDNSFGLLTNEYILIYNNDNKLVDKLRWDGQKFNKLSLPKIKGFKAKNELQECALDLLNNDKIPIKIICGTYGSGKTMLAVKTAIKKVLEDGKYDKIMMVRSPVGAGGKSQEIGFLPGSKQEKISDFFTPFIQHIEGGEQAVFTLEQRGILQKEIPFYMKGLSLENTIVICDEAEDMNSALIKLVGTRLSEGSSVIFCGDWKQAEEKYVYDNGLVNAIENLKGDELVGIVVLEDDVRSLASKVFADKM